MKAVGCPSTHVEEWLPPGEHPQVARRPVPQRILVEHEVGQRQAIAPPQPVRRVLRGLDVGPAAVLLPPVAVQQAGDGLGAPAARVVADGREARGGVAALRCWGQDAVREAAR